jgi:membrane fusion protein, protease secretion system
MSKSALTPSAAVQDATARPVTPPDLLNPYRYVRLGWAVIWVGLVGFFLWAGLAPLDKGVPVPGTVMVSGHRKAVQHVSGGILAKILVKEGDLVQAGQVLALMEPIPAKSQADATRSQYLTARLTAVRLQAELAGKAQLLLPAALQEQFHSLPRAMATWQVQQDLFKSRRAALQADLAAMQESLAGLNSHMQALEESRASKLRQQKSLAVQLEGMRELARDGYVPRNRYLEVDRMHAQIVGAIAEDTGNLARLRHQVSETQQRIAQRQDEYQKEVRTQLAEASRDAETLESRSTATDFDLANTEIKAPMSGKVVGLAVFTDRGVLSPGFKLMDIVPQEETLYIEAQVPVHLIDKVKPALSVELMFTAFNQNRTPHVQGLVDMVSADRLVDEKNGFPYYTLHAHVTPEGMRKLGQLQVRPGMPVEVLVKTGERTLLSYLLKPLLDRMHGALREE